MADEPKGALEALTDAVNNLCEVSRLQLTAFNEMIALAKGGGKGATSTTKGSTTAAKAITLPELTKEISEWLGASEKDSPEQVAKKALLKKILNKVGAERVNKIETGKVAEANELFQKVKAGEDPFPAEEEPDELL